MDADAVTVKCAGHSATVPREVLNTHVLKGIFSRDVWSRHFTEDERRRLEALLPAGSVEPALSALFSDESIRLTQRPLEIFSGQAAASGGGSVIDFDSRKPGPGVRQKPTACDLDELVRERRAVLPHAHQSALGEKAKFERRRARISGRVHKRYKSLLKEVRQDILGAGLSDVLYALSRQKRHRVADRMCFLEDATVSTAYTGRESKRVREEDIRHMLSERKRQRRASAAVSSSHRHGLPESLYEHAIASRQLPDPQSVVASLSRGAAAGELVLALEKIFKHCPELRAPLGFIRECTAQWASRTGHAAPVVAALRYLSARTATQGPCVERLANGDWRWLSPSEDHIRDRSRAWQDQDRPRPLAKDEAKQTFREEERQRYLHPGQPFAFTAEDGSIALVGPVRGVTPDNVDKLRAAKPVPNAALVAERPGFVTPKVLVLDILARLGTSKCSVARIAALLKDSSFIAGQASDADIESMIIKTLRQLQDERTAGVTYDAASRTCTYFDDSDEAVAEEPKPRLRLANDAGQRPRLRDAEDRDAGHRLGVVPPAKYRDVYGATRLDMSRRFDTGAGPDLSDDTDVDLSSDEGESE